MGLVKPGLRSVLGLLVIAHGLVHLLLLRAWMHPGMFDRDFMPLIFYSVAVTGFTAAGVGLFGVTALAVFVRPLLVLASAYSLVAIVTLGAVGPWWGAGIDVVLLLMGLSGAYRYLPEARRPAPAGH
jgi:hypothetical protein